MLLRFIEISDKIGLILLQHPTAPTMLTTLELQIIKEYKFIQLEPFKSTTTIFSGELYGSQLESCEPISKEECHLKERLTEEFQNRLKNIEQKSLITIATILDPRFKIHFLDKNNSTLSNEVEISLNENTVSSKSMSMQLSPSSASFNTETRSKQIPNQIAQTLQMICILNE
ncbi:PREDICTED: uncharacterized protein LOC105627875 [Atta cephalotes]|uniref:Uncharacterized protein n=1 Tax=Atta cephalotes TaxID=12957 RepID=A0A158P433_ATTCE|nr:PREDICTED: uncharacterized protein LOC105627875 [Atta cephalotes]